MMMNEKKRKAFADERYLMDRNPSLFIMQAPNYAEHHVNGLVFNTNNFDQPYLFLTMAVLV